MITSWEVFCAEQQIKENLLCIMRTHQDMFCAQQQIASMPKNNKEIKTTLVENEIKPRTVFGQRQTFLCRGRTNCFFCTIAESSKAVCCKGIAINYQLLLSFKFCPAQQQNYRCFISKKRMTSFLGLVAPKDI